MPRRKGWDFAQLSSTFPGDPEFVRLSRKSPDDRTFLAAVGLWAIVLADAWHTDDPYVADTLDGYEDDQLEGLLMKVGLIRDGRIVGFEKWTAAVRHQREEDAARKRGVRASPPESPGLPTSRQDSSRGVVVEVEDGVEGIHHSNPLDERRAARGPVYPLRER